MSDEIDLTDIESPTFDRHGLTWHKLSGRDRCKILRGLKARERDQRRATLKDAGVTDEATVFAELDQVDRQKLGQDDFIDHVNAPEGQDEVQELSLRKAMAAAGVKADEVDARVARALDGLTIGQSETNALTAALCGLQIVRRAPVPAPDAGAEGDVPNVPAGEPAPLRGYGS